MIKLSKLFIVLCASAAFLYATLPDSTVIPISTNKIDLPAPTGTSVTPADNKNIAKTTETHPKAKNSWSKIKDLFL